MAPRVSRGPSQTSEDPYGWESREFLRKLCVGKAVTFRVICVVSAINRTFADVELVNVPSDIHIPNPTTSIGKIVVGCGWAGVAPANEGKISSYHEELVALEAEAKSAKRGMHGESVESKGTSAAAGGRGGGPMRTKIDWAPTSHDIEEIFNKYKGKSTSVIVVSTYIDI